MTFKNSQLSTVKGHGFFRKNKAGRLVSGIALAGLLSIAGGMVSADEVTQAAPSAAEVVMTSTSADQPAAQPASVATVQENTAAVAVDNQSVDQAAQTADQAGVEVTQTNPKDYGVAQNQADLNKKQAAIATDQNNQVAQLNQAAKQSQANNQAYSKAKAAVDSNNQVVDTAKQAHDDYVSVKTEAVGKGNTVKDYQAIETKAKTTETENRAKVDQLEKALTAYLNSTDAKAEMSYKTQNVNKRDYETSMKAKVNSETGAFTLSHDMNDTFNDTLGNLGTGVLDGTLLWHSTSNHDGSQTITVDGVKLGKYVYKNYRPSQAPDNLAEFIVKDKNGKVIYNSGKYDVNQSFTDTIDKTATINETIKLDGNGASSSVLQILDVDDNWVYNTHGQVAVKFTTENKKPAKVELVKLDQPEQPEPIKAEYHDYQLAVKQDPAPQETKTVAKPSQPSATLPETGDEDSAKLALAGAAAVISVVAMSSRKRKEQE